MSKVIKLGDIAIFQTGPFGTQFKASEYTKEGIPVINVKNIGYGNIFTNDLDFISIHTKERLKSHILNTGDIVVGRKGSVDRHAYITEEYNGWVQGSDCIRVRCRKGVNSQYISHQLKLDSAKKQINVAAVGSTMASLNTDILKNIKILLPEKLVQDKIELVLSAIEKKIQLNNKINKTLQEQASLLYDYWFTQFDFPDENGKPYKSSGGKMVYNELLKREIPEGWKVAKLLDIANWIGGSQPPKSEHIDFMKEGYVRFIQNRDYAADNHMTYIPITNSNKLCSEYDIMIDKYGDAGKIRFGLAGAYNVALSKIEVKKENAQEYVRRFLESDGIKQYLSGSCIASTRASLNETNLSFLKIAIPLESVLLRFEKLSKKTISLILNNNRETQELTRLRDWLLPMLMNGQATVAEEQKPIFQVIENGTKNEQPDRFALWLQNQGLAARGDIDRQTLREIFDAMDDDDK